MARFSVVFFVLAFSATASALRLSSSAASSNVSSSLKCSPQTPEVPAELRNVGMQLFGSAGKFKAFAAKTKGPCKLTIDGVDMQLVQSAEDESGVEFLKAEQTDVDNYAVRKVDKEKGLIVDIGANIGSTSIFMAKVKPEMQMIAFEPVPPTYFLFLWNLHLNGVPTISKEDIGKPNKPGVLALNEVVGDGQDMEIKWFPGWSVGATTGSKFNTARPRGRRGPEHADEKPESRMVHSLVLPSFLTSHGVESIELLKMDCEGCEFFVIPLLKESMLNAQKVKRFGVEIHPKLSPNKERKQETSEIMARRGCGHLEEKQKVYVC